MLGAKLRSTCNIISLQIEEEAMQELMYQYAADSNVDEYITVSRITRAMATPMWHATSHRH